MRHSSWTSLAVSAVALALAGCPGKKDQGPTSHPSVAYQTVAVAVGSPECPTGGVKVDAGIDDNGNGVLDPAEVDGTEYVCNGATSLVSVTPEPQGVHCLAGGLRVASGVDANGDGALGAAEITTTEYVCNAGAASLVRTTAVAAGATCATGGILVASGLDDDLDGTLDDAEVDASAAVCNGAAGTLVRVVAEPAGARCADGGVVIQTGVDDDGDGTLELAEVDASEYVCNGAPSAAVVPLPLVISDDFASFRGVLDTSDRRLEDGTRGEFYAFTMEQAGTVDLSSIPAGAVEFHVFTRACLAEADVGAWGACFVGRATPKIRLDAGQYVLLVKGTETAYLWGSTPYTGVLRRMARAATGAATIAEHLAAGRAALEHALASHATDDFLLAVEHFQSAAALVGQDTGASAADVDRARFFGGLARVAILLQPYSDLVPGNGLADLGDVLDGFGLGGTRFQRSNVDTIALTDCTTQEQCGMYGCWSQTDCRTKPLSPDSPRGQEVQAFLQEKVASGLEGAVALLDTVTPSFAAELTDQGKTVQLDGTDALFLKGVAHGMLALIRVQQAYDLDLDIDETAANSELRDDHGWKLYGPGDFLAENPFFLKLRSAATLPEARDHATAAVVALRAAIASLRAETDEQSDDLVTIADQSCFYNGMYVECRTVYNPADQLDEMDANLADVGSALAASGPYTFTNGTPADPSDDVTIDASKFFAGVDLRAKLPQFNAGPNGDKPGQLPDPTFGGVLVSSPLDLTTDLDGDGVPDFLNDGYYSNFFPSYFAGRTFSFPYYYGGCVYDPNLGYNVCTYVYGPVTFHATASTFTFVNQSNSATYTGTYSWTADSLTLVFDTFPVANVKTVVATVDPVSPSIQEHGFSAQTVFQDVNGYGVAWLGGAWWSRY